MENDKKYLHDYSLEKFINEVSLYYKIPISLDSYRNSSIPNSDIDMFNSIFIGNARVMSYCIECEQSLTFIPTNSKLFELINSELRNRISVQNQYNVKDFDLPQIIISYKEYFSREYKCAYNDSHSLVVDCKLIKDGNELAIMKIGQYPSIADLQFPEFKKYKSIFAYNDYMELKKALVLFSSGNGVGAFLYLRRVFENLVEEIHQEHNKDIGWDEVAYEKLHFNEKVKRLEKLDENVIPKGFNNFKTKIYDILGKGIHEYNETECLELFNPMKFCIEEILEHRYNEKQRRMKTDQINRVFSKK